MLVEDALQGGDAVSRVCHTWGSRSTQKQLWDLSYGWTPRSFGESRGVLWRLRGPMLSRHTWRIGALRRGSDFAVSPSHHTDTTPARFLIAHTAAPWASSNRYIFKEALIYHLPFLHRLAVLAQRWMRITKVSGAFWLCPEKGLGEVGASFQVHLGSLLYRCQGS